MTTSFIPPKDTKNYTKLSGERWKQAKGFSSNYYVSNMGRILTLTHYGHKNSPAIMKPADSIDKRRPNDKSHYQRTVMDGKAVRVHRVVAQTWLPNPDNLPQINHKNGQKNDNRLVNLEWSTNSENQVHAYKSGLNKPRLGLDNNKTKLTPEIVQTIRREWDSNINRLTRKGYAEKYGVKESAIKSVLENKSWKWLPLTKYGYSNQKKYLRLK